MTINVAVDFSPYPSGRVPKDGDFNGEVFRKELLVPAIKEALSKGEGNQSVVIDLDDVRSFGSSFLEEAFGGLGRETDLGIKDAFKVIKIKCTKSHLKIYRDAINRYLQDAMQKA